MIRLYRYQKSTAIPRMTDWQGMWNRVTPPTHRKLHAIENQNTQSMPINRRTSDRMVTRRRSWKWRLEVEEPNGIIHHGLVVTWNLVGICQQLKSVQHLVHHFVSIQLPVPLLLCWQRHAQLVAGRVMCCNPSLPIGNNIWGFRRPRWVDSDESPQIAHLEDDEKICWFRISSLSGSLNHFQWPTKNTGHSTSSIDELPRERHKVGSYLCESNK